VKVLLLTDIPPSTNYTAGLVLAQACRSMPHGSIVCFSIVNPELQNIELDPDLALPMEFAAKPAERGLAEGAPFRESISYLAEEIRCRLATPHLVRVAADFALRQNVDAIWAVLQGQTMVRVAGQVAHQLNLPLHTQVWDPLSWWLDSHAVDRWHKKRSLAEFDDIMKRSKSCATASWAMSKEYETRYGIHCVPLIACHARDEGLRPEPKLRRGDEVVIGMAGQFYAEQEWQHLIQGLNAANWMVDGRQVRIKVLGHYVPSSPIPEGRCEFLGWRPQAEAICLLSEQTDILYCPYPSQPSLAEVTRLSFPSKLVTYFAAGRPVLFHGPDFASPALFLAQRRAGLGVVGIGPPAAYNALYRLVTEPALYAEIARNAQNVFETEFTLEQMKSRLLDFLGTTEADLASAPAARIAFDPTSSAALLPGPPIVRSNWRKIRAVAVHYARRRIPATGKLIDLLLRQRARRNALRLEKAELATVSVRKLRIILHDYFTDHLARMRENFAKTDDRLELIQKEISGGLLKEVSRDFQIEKDEIRSLIQEKISNDSLIVQKRILETQLEGTKRAYEGLAKNLQDLQRRYDTMLSGIFGKISMMEWSGVGFTDARTRSPNGAEASVVTKRYLDLLEASLTGILTNDVSISPWVDKGFNPELRFLGRDWPEHAQTMIGTVRMRNIRYLVEKVIEDTIPGDLLEAGVWRGGACIYMRGILIAHGQTDRAVWAADSFAGLPVADPERYPIDAGDTHHTFKELAVSLEEVQANFARYGLLDENVRFLKGWFEDTLPKAPIERLALLRLDGDMYSSTIQTLDALYQKVSPGGFVIIDDYILPACRKAVDDFRTRLKIADAIQEVDGAAVFWQKSK
jgi:glycosyltransferase involved in cell wall biosynthesis